MNEEMIDFGDLLEPVADETEVPSNEPVETITEVPDDDLLPEEEEITQTEEVEEDVMTTFLKERGIADPTKIQFENENGEIEDVDFNTLSKEEQLTMLQELTNPGLSDHEIEVVNYLRQNRVTFNEVIDYFANQRLEEYLNENPEARHVKNYSVDDYSDEELYFADLKSKYPSFSDEELTSKLNIAKSDENLFKKEVEVLRESYKALEDQQIKDAEAAEQQQYVDLQNSLMEAVGGFNEIVIDSTDPESDALVIEDEDKRQILAYLLNQDKDGKSQFVKDIENPNTLIELAYNRIYGSNNLQYVARYWKDELKNARKQIADLEKKLEAQKSKGNKTVIVPKENKTNSPSDELTWDGLI